MKELSSNIEYKVYTTQKSRKMLIKHLLFLSRVSLRATIRLERNIKKYINTIKFFPKVGSQVYFDQELPSKYRKMVINKRYILIYFIKKRSIYIETILDSRQKNSYY